LAQAIKVIVINALKNFYLGTGFTLDNLHVALEIDETQPASVSTWERLKALHN